MLLRMRHSQILRRIRSEAKIQPVESTRLSITARFVPTRGLSAAVISIT
jgi:hypothetical protein